MCFHYISFLYPFKFIKLASQSGRSPLKISTHTVVAKSNDMRARLVSQKKHQELPHNKNNVSSSKINGYPELEQFSESLSAL